jgi:hypothetical protein
MVAVAGTSAAGWASRRSSWSLRAPQRQHLSQLEDLPDHGRRRGMGTLLGAVRAIGEALRPEAGVAVEPLVAGLAADAVAPAELGKTGGGVLGIEHEALALVHG